LLIFWRSTLGFQFDPSELRKEGRVLESLLVQGKDRGLLLLTFSIAAHDGSCREVHAFSCVVKKKGKRELERGGNVLVRVDAYLLRTT